MKKFYLLLACTFILSTQLLAQLTGTKTIPGDYATVALAVADLNAQGVGAGGVIFNVAAGHTETSDVPEITATGTVANTIVFQKSGAGANPQLTRLTAGTVVSTTTIGSHGDGIIIINGGDYITFEGIDIRTDAAFTAAGMMEYGYYLKKASATNACKNVTIKNCVVTLNRAAIYSFGIFVSNISGTATVTVTSTGGRSENIKISGNTLTNAYGGIQLRGFVAVSPYDFYDQNIEIGVDAANIISNYGGGATTAYGIYGIYQNNIIIANNTINNTANGGVPTTTTTYGMFLSTGTNSNVEIHHNTVSVTGGGTTASTYGISSGMGASGTNNLVSIHDNTVTSCSYPTATTGDLYLIYQSTTPYISRIYNNTVTGNSITSTSGTLYCIYQSGAVVNEGKIYGNTVTNNTKSGTGIMYGIYNSPATTSTNDIYSNTISGNSGTGTLNGIYQNGGLVTNIFKNQVFNQSSSGATGIVYGMTVAAGPLTTNIFNNFISDLRSPAGDAAADGVRGINITSTTANSSINLDYNTIYLNATSSGINFSSSGVFHTYSATATSGSLTMRNNIIVNVSTPNGTGIVSAFRRSLATSLANFNTATNNNLYYAGTPAANRLIYYDGTNSDLTLAAYKTRVTPRDANAVSELPPFINVATTPYDLHINTTIATQVEGGGTPVAGITDDYDANARNATTPDIGADEFAGIAADVTGPTISYTTLGNTSCLTDRTLSPVTITDASGVNTTAGTRPRLYYKKASNTNTLGATNDNTTDGWKYVEATGAGGSPFSFTTDYSLLFGGAPIIGDVIQYFVVAQDNAGTPNVGINTGTFAATPASVALTAAAFPIGGTPNSYNITVAGLSGTVNVGAAETFKSLTEASAVTGVFANINANGLSGNTTIVLMDASITETGVTALNTIATSTCSGGPFTLTIKPNTTTTLTGSATSGALIRLNGADNVTIDGSNNGSTSRDLTITNTATTAPTAVSLISLGTGSGATNNTVKNCNISTGVQTSIGYGISVGGSTPGTAGADNDNVTIENNNITNCAVGIYAIGTAAVSAGGDDNLNILGNSIVYNGTLANVIAIRIGQTLNSTVSTNTVNVETTASVGIAGISLETGANNTLVSRNLISKVRSTNSGASSIARGIVVGTGQTGSAITISNNVIYNVLTAWPSSTVGYGHAGIFLGSMGGSATVTTIAGGVNLFFNSVYLSGNADRSISANTYALYVGSAVTSVDLRNNAFQNSTVNINAGGTGSQSYAIYSVAPNTAYTTINYNDYYASGSQGVTGFIVSDRITLADIQAGFGQNANSIVADPLFNSTTNLVPQTNSPLIAAGDNSTGITIDYLGTARGNPPTIGAYEQSADLAAPVITYSPLNNTLCLNDRTLLPVTITDAGSGVNIAAGTRPRLYYKKTTNANTWGGTNDNTTDGWKYVEATGVAGSPFSFTTNYLLIFGGVALGDVIQYFVVAQDNAATPNVAINSGVFNATPTSVALTAAAFPITGTIYQYNLITGGLASDVTIGATGTYPSLTGAGGLFAAINGAGLVNDITARIIDAAITEDGTNSLTAINYGCLGTYTLLIKPDVGVTTVLSGTGAPVLINLDGADNITFDGSNNGTSSKDMTIRNLSTTGATLRFINDATNNTVKNTIIEGAVTSTTSGVIQFSTSTGTLGNSNITIMNNEIRDRSDVLSPFANGIYSSGTAGALNASNTISGNNLFNFTANGINLTSTGIGDSWQITNNSFYNNLATPPTAAQTSILVSGGSNHAITGNFIGGQSASAGGSPWTNSGSVIFTGINLAGVGGTGAVSVQNNTIQNISLTTASATLGAFNGMLISGASTVNVGTTTGNTIGHASTTNSIQSSGGSTFIGINSSSTGAVNFSNNTIANFTGTGTGTSIGMRGISHTGSGALTVSNNSIHHLTGASATTSATTASILGIYSASSGTAQVISGNTIYNLVQTNATAATQVIGINLNSSAGIGTISRNWIYGFENPSTSATAYIKGMQSNEGTWTFVNNMISVTNGSNTNGPIIAGIYDWPTGESTVANFNSIYIGGDGSAGTNKSYAYYRADGTTNTLRNNILYNARTGGTGAHYAVSNVSTVPATGWSSDYNDLFAADANTVGEWGTGVSQTFAQWQTSSAGDANSKSILPNFVSTIDLHLVAGTNCGLDGYGIPFGGVTIDYDNQTRDATTPDMGADEFTATYSGTLAGVAGSAVCENKTVSAAGTTYATSVCDLIARVLPSGGAAVSGKIDVCVTLDATQQVFNGEPYVQRHHDISPLTNPATSTATISLYFTDAEFVAYNTNNPAWPQLPTAAGGGSTDPNRANVLVTEFFGTPTTTPSQPGMYTLNTRAVINPVDANITWNGSYWTVTFDITGFGGFYIHSNAFGAPLPITINYFTGVKQGSTHVLNWKVTCQSSARATMILERSADSRNFTPIHTVTADAARCNMPFDHTDAQPLPGMNYYRLKMIDDNGAISYSGIVALLNAVKGFEIISIAPNPVTTGNFKLNVTSATASTMQVIITDMQGRTVSRQSIAVIAGFSSIPMNVSNLSAGTYSIQAIFAGEPTKLVRFVKQ